MGKREAEKDIVRTEAGLQWCGAVDQGIRAAGGKSADSALEPLGGVQPALRASDLQNCELVSMCILSCEVCGSWLQQPKDLATSLEPHFGLVRGGSSSNLAFYLHAAISPIPQL